MKVLLPIGLLSLLAFTHPFAREGSVDVNESELWKERIERARENEKAVRNAEDKAQQQKQEDQDENFYETGKGDKETAEGLVR